MKENFKIAIIFNKLAPYHGISILADGLARLFADSLERVYFHDLEHAFTNPHYASHEYMFPFRSSVNIETTLEKCDVIILQPTEVFSPSMEMYYLGSHTLKNLRKDFPNKIIITLDDMDYEHITPSYVDLSDIYYKINMFYDKSYPSNVKSMALASIPEPEKRNASEKSLDVFFKGQAHGWRHTLIHTINRYWPNCNTDRCSREEYLINLQQAFIGIDLPGVGVACHRHFEIPYFGSLLAKYKTNLIIHNDFIPDEECFIWENLAELKSKVDDLLNDKDRLTKMTQKGIKASDERHSSIHRAKQLIQDIQGL